MIPRLSVVGIKCLAKLAVILSLLPVSGCSVATDITARATVVSDGLRESSFFKAKWKLKVVCSVVLSCLIVHLKPLGNSLTKLQLGEFLV